MKNAINSKIISCKEVLSNLPQNNIKNKRHYYEKVDKFWGEFSSYRDDIYKELKKRYDKIMGIDKNKSLVWYEKEIFEHREQLYLINSYSTVYEKSGLNLVLYNLSKFYKGNLDDVNDNIYKAIEIFKKVGIVLDIRDFCYSSYLREYMKVFLNNYSSNRDILKDSFEKIYWECSDILVHIELNFKYLYWKNKKIFDKYYEKSKNDFLKNNDCSDIEYFNKYKQLKEEYDEMLMGDINTIIRDFISKKYNVNDYSSLKIDKCYSEILCGDNIEDNKIVASENLIKLYNSLVEYKNYSKYTLFVDSVRKIYEEKSKYKDVFKNKFNDIVKLEKKIISLNKKLDRCVKFKRSDKVILGLKNNINSLILEIKELYDFLDFDRFNDDVSKLDDNASIFEILCLVSSNYLVFRKIFKDDKGDISDIDINQALFEMREFILSPYNNIINNITIGISKDIPLVISDRYKLLNFNIPIDSIAGNVDGVIDNVYKIILYNKINDGGLEISDIMFINNVYDVMEENTQS